MRIPTKGRYAVSAMFNLAINDRIGPVTIADIADQQAISLSYLEQLFARLRKSGLVEGTRGPGGGYRLAVPAEEITIARIIAAVDDNASNGDAGEERYLPYALWQDLSQRLHEFLDGITVADCVARPEVEDFVTRQLRQSGSRDRSQAAA